MEVPGDMSEGGKVCEREPGDVHTERKEFERARERERE